MPSATASEVDLYVITYDLAYKGSARWHDYLGISKTKKLSNGHECRGQAPCVCVQPNRQGWLHFHPVGAVQDSVPQLLQYISIYTWTEAVHPAAYSQVISHG